MDTKNLVINNAYLDIVEGNNAILFNIGDSNDLLLEWMNPSFDENHYVVERINSNLKLHATIDANIDYEDLFDALDEKLKNIPWGLK